MAGPATDTVFAGSIPEFYDRLFVPLLFEPYAADTARRAAALQPKRVLETAAGTGAVTRALARALPAECAIVATDLNGPMLERARQVGTARPVHWQVADALALPFDDASTDLVVCQFGVMFFPDRARGYAEARRVLRPGGTFLFNAWDKLADNGFAATIGEAFAALYPADPPRFLERTPHGYHDPARIAADLRDAGYAAEPSIETVALQSRGASAAEVAAGFCQGTPLRNEIVSRGSVSLEEATAACAAALRARYGDGPIEAKMQALVVTVAR